MATSRRIDAKVRMEVCRRHPSLTGQVEYMERRQLLQLLGTTTLLAAPIGAVLVNGARPSVTVDVLDGLEGVSTTLAASYRTAPPAVLIGAVSGHLETITGHAAGSMRPFERDRLGAIAADTAIFVGGLSLALGKLAQADAYFGLAERLAREVSAWGLVAQALEWQSDVNWYRTPDAGEAVRHRITLLEEAETLAARHAPPVVHLAAGIELALARARTGDAHGVDVALERASKALERMRPQDAVTGFGSTVGSYSGYGEATWHRTIGGTGMLLNRSDFPAALERALAVPTITAGNQVICRAELAVASVRAGEPEEAVARLREALPLVACPTGTPMRHVSLARASMPPEWCQLDCVRGLDEQVMGLMT
ncbi:MAG: hypothetical protein ACRD0K_10515 [Egibacteraceae bacterium]